MSEELDRPNAFSECACLVGVLLLRGWRPSSRPGYRRTETHRYAWTAHECAPEESGRQSAQISSCRVLAFLELLSRRSGLKRKGARQRVERTWRFAKPKPRPFESITFIASSRITGIDCVRLRQARRPLCRHCKTCRPPAQHGGGHHFSKRESRELHLIFRSTAKVKFQSAYPSGMDEGTGPKYLEIGDAVVQNPNQHLFCGTLFGLKFM